MAGADDFGAFESNFLDSMLEVQMTEVDGEVKISQNDDHPPVNERELPPVPRFDLQSQTMTFKTPYGNSILPVKQTSILKSNAPMPASPFPLPALQPSPMIFIRSNMLKKNNVAIKPRIIPNPPPAIVGKSNPLTKTIMTKPPRTSNPTNKPLNNFVMEVFKPDFVKKVYLQKENLPNVTVIGPEEDAFYKVAFKDVSKVQLCRLHCTICDKHLGCGKAIEKKISIHGMLKVLTCKVCSEFYGDGNFPCDDGDHCEIYCRWCGQGGALICCSYCPKVFCKRCVRRNFNQTYCRAVEKSSDWACFVCAQRPLWPHRAVCRALVEYLKTKKAPIKDTSMCCKPQRAFTDVERNKIFMSRQPVQIRPKGVPLSQTIGKTQAPATITKAASTGGPGPLIVNNFSTALKVNSQTKAPVAVINTPHMIPIAPKISATTSTNRATTSKTITPIPKTLPASVTSATSAAKLISGIKIPHLINAPIYHGQTLITPPRNNTAALRNPPIATVNPLVDNRESPEPTVKVSVADCVNVDITKIPVARIPSYVQGVILRLNFPDNKVQLVRLVRDGNDEDVPFPIPKIGNGESLDFLECCIEDTFKLSRMLYQRLMVMKEKLDTKTILTKNRVYKEVVENLSFIYGKSREIMKELDDYLLGGYESWERENEGEEEQENEGEEEQENEGEEEQENEGEEEQENEGEEQENEREQDNEGEQENEGEEQENEGEEQENEGEQENERELETDVSVIDLSDDEECFSEKQDTFTNSSDSSKVSSRFTTSYTGSSKISSHDEDSDIEIVTPVCPQVTKRSGIKRDSDGNPSGSQIPEHVDVGAYVGKKKNDANDAISRKKVKMSEEEEGNQESESDPLAVSDTEYESNSQARHGPAQSSNTHVY